MRHKNSVKQLGRTHSHRKAMYSNMVTSFFINERIITTKQKGKELKKISERLITRAKRNLFLQEGQVGERLHNKRVVMRVIRNRDVVAKLFDDIAHRYMNRNGGYTRLLLLGRRSGDAAEMALVELIEKKSIKDSDALQDKKEKDKKDKNKK
ncbi:MAG: 50S ribosomal protein L17 [Spirochaetota bacterium]|nr:50S ribosomal protein L17 [Spirochaetota bacterium]